MTFAEQDLLAPLDAAPCLDHLAEMKQRLDDEAQDYARAVGEGVRSLLGSARWFDEGYRGILRDVSSGKAAEIQKVREPILDAFQHRLALLFQAARLARHAEQLTGHVLPELAPLEAEVGEMGKRLMSLMTRWQTAGDLAGLTEEKIQHRVSHVEFRRLSPEQRDDIMRRSAELAEEDYRTNPELLCFEAFGEKDLYDDYPDTSEG
jgi:hypothetical protein